MAPLPENSTRLDPRGATRQTWPASELRALDRLTRMTKRDAQLNRTINHDLVGVGDGGAFRSKRPRAGARMLHLAIMAAIVAIPVQALAQPQPIPRPPELRQAPVAPPEAPAHASPSPAPERPAPPEAPIERQDERSAEQPPSPRSRAEQRALHHTCGEEWSRMMKAGKTTGLIWVDFFETCQKRP